MSVWVVEQGEYSDSHILGVCSTKEMADELMRFFEEARATEYELDVIPDHPPGLYPFCVEMLKDGTVVQIYSSEYSEHHPAHQWNEQTGSWRICAWAEDEEHAIKIANERRVWLISENLWFHIPSQYPDPVGDARRARIRAMWGKS